jgi:hypothetical protein
MGSRAVTITPDPSGPVTITPDGMPPVKTPQGLGKVSDPQQSSPAFAGGYPNEIISGLGRAAKGLTKGLYDEAQPRGPVEQGQMDALSGAGGGAGSLLGYGLGLVGHLYDDTSSAMGKAAKAEAFSRKTGEGIPGQLLSAAEQEPLIGPMVQYAEKGGTKAFNPQSVGAAAEGIGYATMQRAAGRVAATAVGDIKGPADPLAWKEGLVEMSHQMLDKSANAAKRTLWDTRQKVSENVGNLINEISAKDAQASPNGSINVSDLIPKVEEIANAYKAQDGRLPNFDKIAGRVTQQNPNVSWYELHKLKTEVGKAAIAASDPADAAAVSKIEAAIDEKLTARAKELDATIQNAAYKKQWSTLKAYEGQGVLGDLLKAPSGKDFFDILNDPKKSGPLGNMVKDLNNFGLPEDFRTKLRSDHAGIYQYVTDAQKSGFGKIRVLMQHPIAGTAGFLGGRALGSAVGSPMLGGIMGSLGAGSMVDRITAARNIRSLGGPAPIEGEMGDLGKVKGQPTEPPTSTRSPILKDVTDALVSQGMKKTDAAQAAQRGVSEFPDDFDKAFSTALRRPERVVPQSKADKIKAVKGDKSSTGFVEAFQGARPGDAFVEQMFNKLKAGDSIPFQDKAGGLENKLWTANKEGRLNSIEDAKEIMLRHYAKQP